MASQGGMNNLTTLIKRSVSDMASLDAPAAVPTTGGKRSLLQQIIRRPAGTVSSIEFDLTPFCRRLEAATSRLEDITSTTGSDPSRQDHAQNQQAPIQSKNLHNESGQHAGGQASGQTDGQRSVPPSVAELDSILHDDLKPFFDLSQKLGGLVAEQVVGLRLCLGNEANSSDFDRLQPSRKPFQRSDKLF